MGLFTLLGCKAELAQDPLWDPEALPVFRIEFEGADWEERLLANHNPTGCEDRVYTRASVEFDNPMTGEREAWSDVGVRYRGHNVFMDSGVERSGFKLSFDEFVEDRTFHSVRKVNLLGTEGDYSLLHERLAFAAMGDMGVPAPRINHALVYVNGVYQGVFPNSEEADDQPFLTAHFDDDGGSLYKVKGYCGYRADLTLDDGDDVASYTDTYEPKAGTDPEDMQGDLLELLACSSTADDAAFEGCIERWIDLDEWLTEMAVDMVMPDVDGMASAGQNFLLYFDPSIDRFVVYPWDKDLAFFVTTLDPEHTGIFDLQPSWLEGSAPALADRLRQVYADRFCARVLDATERLAPDRVAEESRELHDLLEADIRRDPFLRFDQWEAAVDGIRTTLEERVPAVIDEATTCVPPT